MPLSYTMKMHELLWKAGFENTGDNRRLLDKAVREVLNLPQSEDTEVWDEIQKVTKDNPSKKEFEGKIIKILLTY